MSLLLNVVRDTCDFQKTVSNAKEPQIMIMFSNSKKTHKILFQVNIITKEVSLLDIKTRKIIHTFPTIISVFTALDIVFSKDMYGLVI